MTKIRYETTTIPASKSISEIQGFLARMGATKIMFEYDDKGNIKALIFGLNLRKQSLSFKLPAKPEAVYKIIFGSKENPFKRQEDKRIAWEEKNKTQSLNISWRIIKEWVEIQFALIEMEQAEAAEIFMPYLMVEQNKTLYESAVENNFNMLNDGGGSE